MEYKGHIYQPYTETEYDGDGRPENVKIWHEVQRPDGSTVSMDWSPYDTPTLPDFCLWIDLGLPDRFTLRNAGGPLDRSDLDELSRKVRGESV
jgi:hypothetical protein